MNVNTRKYEITHGKQPRGWGMWGFFIGNDTEPFWHTGKYADAKRAAITLAVLKKATEITVAP